MIRLAQEPGDDCCDEGTRRVGKAQGVVKNVGGLQTYVASPPALSNRILLFFSDVHGPFHINNQLLMDYFASKGIVRQLYLQCQSRLKR